jgi:hypothetical protein
MTPNPTVRPFVLGALLFVTLISLWPGHAHADRGAPQRPAAVASQR